jgi:hypothetical protein
VPPQVVSQIQSVHAGFAGLAPQVVPTGQPPLVQSLVQTHSPVSGSHDSPGPQAPQQVSSATHSPVPLSQVRQAIGVQAPPPSHCAQRQSVRPSQIAGSVSVEQSGLHDTPPHDGSTPHRPQVSEVQLPVPGSTKQPVVVSQAPLGEVSRPAQAVLSSHSWPVWQPPPHVVSHRQRPQVGPAVALQVRPSGQPPPHVVSQTHRPVPGSQTVPGGQLPHCGGEQKPQVGEVQAEPDASQSQLGSAVQAACAWPEQAEPSSQVSVVSQPTQAPPI